MAYPKFDPRAFLDGGRPQVGGGVPAKVANPAKAGNEEGRPTLAVLATLAGTPPPASPTAPPSGGRWLMLVQLWNAEKGRDLVSGLIAAAGPNRAGGLDQVFEKLRTRCSWNSARKIEYLEELREKLAANPLYWPADRPDLVIEQRARFDKVILTIKRNGGRITRKKLLRHANRHTIQAMLDLREIVTLGVGVYGLPGAPIHRSASRMIVERLAGMVLAGIADPRITRTELRAAIGRERNCVDRGIEVLHENGIILIRGNTIRLSPKALKQIKDNEVIRLRHGNIMWSGSCDQLDLFPTSEASTQSPPPDESGRDERGQ